MPVSNSEDGSFVDVFCRDIKIYLAEIEKASRWALNIRDNLILELRALRERCDALEQENEQIWESYNGSIKEIEKFKRENERLEGVIRGIRYQVNVSANGGGHEEFDNGSN